MLKTIYHNDIHNARKQALLEQYNLIIKEIHKVGKYEMRNSFNILVPIPTAVSNPDSSETVISHPNLLG